MASRRQWLNEATQRLTGAGASDARLDAQWMLAQVLSMPRLLMLVELDESVAPEAASRFEALVSARESGKPLQYVLGEADFMGRTFSVDERVLIPRADTETLCEAALARLRPQGRALEIGAGSGAVAVSLALERPHAQVTAVDISPQALEVARANGLRHGAAVEWLQSDLYAALDGRVFDVILSNPPYIPTGELAALQAEVRREPRLALDGGADGLVFYRRLLGGLPGRLAGGGSLLLEVGDGQSREVSALVRPLFDKTEILRDLAGLERVVAGDGYAG